MIRSYAAADAEAVRNICIETSSAYFQPEAMHRLLLAAYCNYYIEQEPSNCFVAADESDNAVGYILCAEDAEKWKTVFKQKYIEGEADAEVRRYLAQTLEIPAEYTDAYPAHLHIDILPQHQRAGLGTKLMDTLINHLKSKSVPGLMLGVSADNEKGIGFYKKYGFKVLVQDTSSLIMGKIIE